METILGIDLGTTNSIVSVIRDDDIQVLEEAGQKMLPSVVGLDTDGNILVGSTALNQWTLAPERTIRSIKRKMGSDESIQLGDQTYSPQEISAMILRTLKERAARQLGVEVCKAVITVPAFFNEQQREATRAAGNLAGLEVVRIINEPTAAALTYETNPEQLQRLLVYDLGGGTFDVSIVQMEQGVVEVLSSHGDTQLGGDDFDELLMDFVCDRFNEDHQIDLRQSPTSKSRVLKAVEQAKQRLSFEPFTMLEEEFIAEQAGVPLHLNMELSRREYEPLIESLLEKTLVCVDEALSDAKLTALEIDRVVLVGGSSRTPMVHRMLQDQLGQPIHAEVDPDLCVSMGAAIQGGLIAGVDLGPVLVDITPHTLGIDCLGVCEDVRIPYHFARLIDRNSALPASRSEVFQTSHDGQKAVLMDIYQGEHDDTRRNEFAGSLRLDGLADASRGNAILVRFDLNLDGILTVTATEKATGLEETVTIDNAMSRFRSNNHEAAKKRLDSAFAHTNAAAADAADAPGFSNAPDIAAASVGPTEQLPAELQAVIGNAGELLRQAERLVPLANGQDADEIRDLISQLNSAIGARSADDIRDISAKLDELVFYLQDSV